MVERFRATPITGARWVQGSFPGVGLGHDNRTKVRSVKPKIPSRKGTNMRCLRCDGLMVSEKFDEPVGLESRDHKDAGWRCINCGAIVDPVIAANRRLMFEAAVFSRTLTAA